MKKALKWLDVNFEPLIVTIIFFAMLTLVSTQVVLRFIFESGFAWGEELSRYMYVWLVFCCLSYVVRNNKQISVAFARNMINPKAQKVIVLIVDIIFFAFIIILLRSSIGIVMTTAKFGDKGMTLPVTLNVMYVAGIVGYSLMLIRFIQVFIWKIKRFKCSFELFLNEGGLYSNVEKTFHMPKDMSQDLIDLQNPDVVEEERRIK